MPKAKKNKMDRNQFLMVIGPQRSAALVRKALNTRSMKLTGVEDFEGAMDAIVELFNYAYSKGVCDTIDALIDGVELEKIE
jgi:hypothetical protein